MSHISQANGGGGSDEQAVRIRLPKIFVPPCPEAETYSQRGWNYELRHLPQEILPGLWIGPLSVLRDEAFIEGNNIRFLVSVTDTRVKPLALRQKYMPSPDYSCHAFDPGNKVTNPLAIVSQLKSICDVIQQAQAMSLGTLIFCESGNEQSAVAAAAYLIYARGMSMIEAVQHVQGRRFSISLDDAAKHNLQTFHDLCLAHRFQQDQSPGGTPSHGAKVARGRDDDDEEDQYSSMSPMGGKRRMRQETTAMH